MSSLLQDLRLAVRQLARRPAFALSAVLSLALGLGANISIFSLSEALLLRLPPAREPHRLVRIYVNHHSPFTYPDYRFIKENNVVFSDVIAESSRRVALSLGGESERAVAHVVSGNYFSALGLAPAVGRFFPAGRDEVPSAVAEVVVSWRFWRTRLGADPDAVGRSLRLNDRVFRVAGVAPEGFTSALTLIAPDVFVPIADTRTLFDAPPEVLSGSLYLTARLKDHVTPEQADANVGALMRRLHDQDPENHRGLVARVGSARGVNAELRDPVLVASGGALVFGLLVLFVACANVGNLLLARNTARRREIGIRVAIGGGRARIVRQLLAESAVLASAAAVLSLLAASWTSDLVTRVIPSDAALSVSLGSDTTVVVFAGVLALVTILVAGIAPALHVTSPDVVDAIRADARSLTVGGSRLRDVFLFAQVALSTLLLCCAALFSRSLLNARVIDPGYDTSRIVDITADWGGNQYTAPRTAQVWDTLLTRVRAIPGVEAATAIQYVPLTGTKAEISYFLPGDQAPTDAPTRRMTQFASTAPNYFEMLGIPILAGRPFLESDRAGGPAVAIVNETFARRVFPQASAIGQRMSFEGPAGPWYEVVGIVRDTKYNWLGESGVEFVYLPYSHGIGADVTVQARLAPGASIARVTEDAIAALRDADRALAPPVVRMLEDEQRVVLLPSVVAAGALGLFGALALVLAAVGLFGVAAYTVAQRTREIGVRCALGARSADVLRVVLDQTLRSVALGAAAGLAFALVAAQALRSLLYDVGAVDPTTFAGVPLLLAFVAVAATLVPARRALRVDPVVALRAE